MAWQRKLLFSDHLQTQMNPNNQNLSKRKFCKYSQNAKKSNISNWQPFFKRIWLISLPLKMHCWLVEPVSNTSEAYT